VKCPLCNVSFSRKYISFSIYPTLCILKPPAGAAFGGGKWGDRPRPRSWGGPALQACEFVKLYSPVNWKCWYMLRLKSFFKVKFRSVVLECLLYRNRLWNLKLESVKAAILKIFLQRIIYARCPQTGKIFMNNEKTKFVRQVAKVDLV